MDVQGDNEPILLFGLYRWAGTTPDQFREHYLSHHAPEIGAKMPGVKWYYTFLNRDPQTDGNGAPRPDAFAIMCMESDEALARLSESEKWAEAVADNQGFISHFDTYRVERVTLIGEAADSRAGHSALSAQ